MRQHWLRDACRCAGAPALFCSLLYGALGLLFLLGSRYLDPIMATVGAILLATSLVFPGGFVLVAYFQRSDSPRRGR